MKTFNSQDVLNHHLYAICGKQGTTFVILPGNVSFYNVFQSGKKGYTVPFRMLKGERRRGERDRRACVLIHRGFINPTDV